MPGWSGDGSILYLKHVAIVSLIVPQALSSGWSILMKQGYSVPYIVHYYGPGAFGSRCLWWIESWFLCVSVLPAWSLRRWWWTPAGCAYIVLSSISNTSQTDCHFCQGSEHKPAPTPPSVYLSGTERANWTIQIDVSNLLHTPVGCISLVWDELLHLQWEIKLHLPLLDKVLKKCRALSLMGSGLN